MLSESVDVLNKFKPSIILMDFNINNLCMYILLKTWGLNHLFRRIIFSNHGHGKLILKNCISCLWSEEIIVIGYNLVKCSSQFYGKYFCLQKNEIFYLIMNI